jgi:CheY-like chemotaxis protein
MPPKAPTILVVDDEEMVLRFVNIVLTKAGFRVLAASGGPAALKLCNQGAEEIDVAVLDVVMPQLDGPHVFERLRQAYPNLRVLFMSGYTEAEVTRRCGGREVAEFLKKPFTSGELLARVKQIVEGQITVQA